MRRDDAVPEPIDPDSEPSQVITPGSPVHMSLRVLIGGIVSIVALAGGAGVGYSSLASADSGHAEKVKVLEEKIRGMVTKSDLEVLRERMRADLLSSTWDCAEMRGGGMRCTPLVKP